MRTRYVATISLDTERVAKDLQQSSSFHWSEAYSDYLFGGPWRSCVLWAAGGDSGDGIVTNYAYDQPPTFTEYAMRLSYLRELITNTVDLARLNFVRLATVANSVIIPHRDLLELSELPDDSRNAHRMHIPLATNDQCFFSEDNQVFRMAEGEIWFLDASRIHSVAALSDEPRTHLIFDFVDKPDPRPLVRVETSGEDAGIPADRIVRRPALSDADRATLLRLADVLRMDTFSEVFSVVIKTHFRCDGGEDFVWETMTGLARGCSDPAVLPHTLKLRRYFTLERSA